MKVVLKAAQRTRVVLLAALLCVPAVGHAGDLRGVRVEALRGELQSLRWQALRAPRASVHDLKQLRRRLAEQRVMTPDDPRLARLELQRRHAQWQAERALRAGRGAASRARLESAAGRLQPPGYARAPTDLDLRGSTLPIGAGQRFLLIQSGLRAARAALGGGRAGAAAQHLMVAERGFRDLQTEAGVDDPNLVALAAEIRSVRALLAATDGAG